MATKYRAAQVGSFLRPPELVAARESFVAGKITEDDLREAQDNAILKVIDLQKQSGIDVLSDGEYRRGGWASDFGEAVEGYVVGAPAVAMSFQGGADVTPVAGANSTNPTGAPGGGPGCPAVGPLSPAVGPLSPAVGAARPAWRSRSTRRWRRAARAP